MINPLSTRELSKLIYEYYSIEENGAGGNCHIVLDDGNLGDKSVQFCIDLCIKNNDEKGRYLMEQFILIRKTARGKSIKLFYELDRNVNNEII